MKTQEYSNREIDEMKEDIFRALGRIENQTTKTNGSVADIQRWKERMMGALYVTLIVVMPLLSWGLYQITQIPEKVTHGIEIALESYQIYIEQ